MSSEYFKRRRMPWTITNVSKNIYGQDIMLICSKWKAQKTYMGSEVRYTEANETSTVDAQLSVVDGIGMGEAEIIYYITWRLHIDLTSEVFDDGTITD